MTPPDRLPLASLGPLGPETTSSPAGSSPGGDLLDLLLAEQQSLTAVERFSLRHEGGTETAFLIENKTFYRDLIPLRAPGPGEQYAFEVDLDRCTGCKACVTACHNLNGLDDDETWRSVGVLQRTSATDGLKAVLQPGYKPAHQHVTTACHHCADPGCAQGCPTLAYEKDPATGAVRHLDDQCFGCQYCILKCPYDVPQYNPKRGIVRKCDLCVGRLRAGEAPACAQACPTQAIRVTLVDTQAVRRAPDAAFDLPDVPDPSRVHPTTRYVSRRGLPPGMEAVDAAQVRAEHAHHPLTAMLVASQAAAGYWVLIAVLSLTAPVPFPASSPATSFPWREVFGTVGVHAALGLSLLHLGRPWLAWKAFLGWRRSWLSREVIAFSAFAGATSLYAVLRVGEWYGGGTLPAFGGKGFALHPALPLLSLGAAAISACAAVYASAMVYRDTPRALWANRTTLWRFALTSALCGVPAWLVTSQVVTSFFGRAGGSGTETGASLATVLWLTLPFLIVVKLVLESSVLRHRDEGTGPLWKAAQLLLGPLRSLRAARIALGLLGAGALPFVLSGVLAIPLPGPDLWWTTVSALLITGGELLERHLFFVTAVAPRMPGGRT